MSLLIYSDINHKDKLVAVVMPVLQTPNLSSGDKESTLSLQVNTSNVEETPSRSLLATPHSLCEDDIQSITHSLEQVQLSQLFLITVVMKLDQTCMSQSNQDLL